MTRVLCVLPARLGSRRLPRKPLRTVAGSPLVRWSWETAARVPVFDEVRVATDSPEVAEAVEDFGGRAVLTDPGHATGTDRVAEAAGRPWASGYGVVVNFQADEPFLDPEGVEGAVRAVADSRARVATLAERIDSRERWRSPDVVKVVRAADGRALYFSRAPVPHGGDGPPEDGPGAGEGRAADEVGAGGGPSEDGSGDAPPLFLRHAGLYVFRREALRRWTRLPGSRLEAAEDLEQLRALEAGMEIHVELGSGGAPGVDTPADLERASRRIERGNHTAGNGHEC